MVAPVAVTVLERAGAGAGESADLQGLETASKAPGMDPQRLASAWGMTTAQATSLLRGTSAAAAHRTHPARCLRRARADGGDRGPSRRSPRVREPWISGEGALRERMSDPEQTAPDAPVPDLPPYAVAFLAHLRLLIGVPFDYLVPDPRMLPDESIRFFHLDRSWTDRLVDGVFAVGKIGTREQAHHQAAAADIEARLDEAEPGVRPLQRGLGTLQEPAATAEADAGQPITGLLLRSALVSGWPHMDVLRLRDGSQAHAAAARAARAVGADRAVRRRPRPASRSRSPTTGSSSAPRARPSS